MQRCVTSCLIKKKKPTNSTFYLFVEVKEHWRFDFYLFYATQIYILLSVYRFVSFLDEEILQDAFLIIL